MEFFFSILFMFTLSLVSGQIAFREFLLLLGEIDD